MMEGDSVITILMLPLWFSERQI